MDDDDILLPSAVDALEDAECGVGMHISNVAPKDVENIQLDRAEEIVALFTADDFAAATSQAATSQDSHTVTRESYQLGSDFSGSWASLTIVGDYFDGRSQEREDHVEDMTFRNSLLRKGFKPAPKPNVLVRKWGEMHYWAKASMVSWSKTTVQAITIDPEDPTVGYL